MSTIECVCCLKEFSYGQRLLFDTSFVWHSYLRIALSATFYQAKAATSFIIRYEFF